MLEAHYKYVLVGGGLASASAADAIRQRDRAGSILLVGQEVNQPYHRPHLSSDYLSGQRKRGDVIAEPMGWFGEHNVALRTGGRVANLDTARRMIVLSSGEEVSFDQLLIATGASPKPLTVPGAQLPNVFMLRTIDDADRLHNAIEKARTEGHKHPNGEGRGLAAVIGGGVLGVELAATLTRLGLSIDLICGPTHPWRKFVGENTGKLITHHLEQHGVRVHSSHRPERLEGDGRVQRIVLSNEQTVVCDLAISAVGALANKEILRGTPITAEKAILTDDHCRTNVEGIYAAGDCAAVFDPLFAKHRLIDHWANARITGAIAGANMAGGDLAYDIVNSFSTNVFGLNVTSWGEPRLVDRRHVRGNVSIDAPDYVEIGVASDGRISQVISVGPKGEDELLMQLVKQRVQIDGNEEEIKDPARPLSEFLTE
jgi:NAD(P)H-nitrite reductase large subunit